MGKTDRITKDNGRISLVRLYNKILTIKSTRNESEGCIRRQSNIYMDYKGVYSGSDRISFIYSIENLPSSVPLNLNTRLRDVCKGRTRISVITKFSKYSLDLESRRMQSKLSALKMIDNDREEVTAYNANKQMKGAERSEWITNTLFYLVGTVKNGTHNMLRLRKFVIVSGFRGEDFDTTVTEFEALCKNKLGIEIHRVMNNIPEVVSIISPFNTYNNEKIYNQFGSYTLTDEIASRLVTVEQGKVGNRGITWGSDLEKGMPVNKPVKTNTVDAENWLIVGETGSGKSALVKFILGQLLGMPKMTGTIMDVEGDEYLGWVYLIASSRREDVVLLNMAEGEGRYIDAVEIIATGDENLDKGLYGVCVNFTLSMLKAMVNLEEDKYPWCKSILSSALAKVYTKNKVNTDSRTWKNSKGLTLFDVYNEILKTECDDVEEKKTWNLMVANLQTFFEPNGMNRDMLKEPVSILEIVKAKLVVCSFGLKNKTEVSIDSVKLQIAQISAANISYMRSIFAQSRGLYNFKIWEEYQRWGKFKGNKDILSVALTGGRKLGDINIIVTNKLGELLKTDTTNIIESISSFAVGGIADEDVRREFCRRQSIDNLKIELDRIAQGSKDGKKYDEGDISKYNPYSYSFLMGFDRIKYVVAKAMIPKEYLDTQLFKTGV